MQPLRCRACIAQAKRQSFTPSALAGIINLHTNAPKGATPVPHPVTPGPPPKAPTPLQTGGEDANDPGARKRRQAELLKLGQALRTNPSKPGTALQKRFWKNVLVEEVDNGFQVLLDSRPVRAPSTKQVLTLPKSKRQLATAISMEWDHLVSAQQALKQQYVPLTQLCARAVDLKDADTKGNGGYRASIVQTIIGYLNTDTLLCWESEGSRYENSDIDKRMDKSESLRSRQMKAAQPIIDFLKDHVWPGVEINPSMSEDSILATSQPELTQEVIKGWMTGLPPFELVALERAVFASKSVLIAARLLVEWSGEFASVRESAQESAFTIEDAARAATLEVAWQTGMWGEVEDTHDVDKEDIRRQLGSAIMLVHERPEL